MKPRVGVFHPGTQHSWQTARALQKNEMLAWYITSIFYDPDKWFYRLIDYLPYPIRFRANEEFRRFYHPDLDPKFVRTAGAHELGYRIARRAGLRRLANTLNRRSNDYLSRRVARFLKQDMVDLLWGYDGCSLDAFRSARRFGIPCILDKTVGDLRIYNEIMSRVFDTYPNYFFDKNFKEQESLIEIQNEEYNLADTILTGSVFCADTILAVRPDLSSKIRILKYCYDDIFFPKMACPACAPVKRPIRFIFVGHAGPRKGIHLVLRAFRNISASAATLTILGSLGIPKTVFAEYADRVTLIPTVQRVEVATFMVRADCLVLPSYFEGSAISIYEALAAGLGVIQSKNTGMEIDSSVGVTLETLSESELTKAVMSVIETPHLLKSWKSNARRFAEAFTFERYVRNVRRVADEVSSLGHSGGLDRPK